MSFDFSKVKSVSSKKRHDSSLENPIELFYTLKHPAVDNLYPVQNDILKEWYIDTVEQAANDHLISLDTGAGKTLVGLLIAESMRRKTGKKVFYLCPNNYLVSQTQIKAKEYGITLSTYSRGQWLNENDFLENKSICVTNYDALFNTRSIFKRHRHDIGGVVFDDAHLSIELLHKHFTLEIDFGSELGTNIIQLFQIFHDIQSKIESLKQDPSLVFMIPTAEWLTRIDKIHYLLKNDDEISQGYTWFNLKEKLNLSMCFVSSNKIEITLLYPDIKDHFLLSDNVLRAYLSATLSNADDIIRTFGMNPKSIIVDNYGYRPERLFIFSKIINISDPERSLRDNINNISKKALVLVPAFKDFDKYKCLNNVEFLSNTDEAELKIEQFKVNKNQILVLANRYDGIDLKGDQCRLLVVDGFPFINSLKIRYFSEYLSKENNDFLRSYLSSKVTQAFGRTVRSYDDYSVVFVIGDNINKFLINKNNERFFKTDLLQDLAIGKNLSEKITDNTILKDLCEKMLSRADDWNEFIVSERKNIVDAIMLSDTEQEMIIGVAKAERKIIDAYYDKDYLETLRLIDKYSEILFEYSRETLGIYMNIAAICHFELKNMSDAIKYSEHSYKINKLFGKFDTNFEIGKTQRAKTICSMNKELPIFEWNCDDALFEENMRVMGDCFGFISRRPEKEKDGTLDVLWEDAENKVVAGFAVKANKKNLTLSKEEIAQVLEQYEWIKEKYPDHQKLIFVVGEFESYNRLATPTKELYHINFDDLNTLNGKLQELHTLKITKPNHIDAEILRLHLDLQKMFKLKRIVDLNK